MPSFSQRYGYKATEQAFQRERVDETLRLGLWSVMSMCMWDQWEYYDYGYESEQTQKINILFRRLWFNYFKNDMDRLPSFRRSGRSGNQTGYDYLKAYFLKCEWYEVYDLIEWLLQDDNTLLVEGPIGFLNSILERENAAYRIVGKAVAEITDAQEIAAIEDAISIPDQPIREHISTALALLSDRTSPDYRNSIKESISAVEACCRLVTGMKAATLGEALKKVPDIHPALTKAFLALYGFTSDSGGIRHSLMDESTLNYADAKFMLSTCSAFVSYLKQSTTNEA